MLTPPARRGVQRILGATNISRAAVWPDVIKGLHIYNHTYSRVHYVDTHDSPPDQCGFNVTLDCPDNWCVTAAISNYAAVVAAAVDASTEPDKLSRKRFSGHVRLLGLGAPARDHEQYSFVNVIPATPPTLRQTLMLLIHLVGDVHQPLHVCGREIGGNDVPVVVGRRHTELHAVWDSVLIELQLRLRHGRSIPDYVRYLYGRIRMAEKSTVAEWTSCPGDVTVCPETWALQSNRLNCDVVWPGVDAGVRLDDDYISAATSAIEQQLILGGVRLAAALNGIFD